MAFRFITVSCLCIILFSSCQEVKRGKGAKSLEQLSWMQGTWKMDTPEGVLQEQWTVANDTLWQARSYMTSQTGDTLFQETIDLKQTEGSIYYIPTVPSQNGGKPVSFKATKASADEAIFENSMHDFPQRIIYKRTSDTTIVAAVEGQEGGQHKREEFRFSKQ